MPKYLRMLTVIVAATLANESISYSQEQITDQRLYYWVDAEGTLYFSDGSIVRDVTKTGTNGATIVTNGTITYTQGTASRDTVRTGPNGNSVTVDGNITYADGTLEREVVRTAPSGNSSTVNGQITKTEDGQFTADRVRSGVNGNEWTQSAHSYRTQNGFLQSGTTSGPYVYSVQRGSAGVVTGSGVLRGGAIKGNNGFRLGVSGRRR